MKKAGFLLFILIFLVACSDDQVTPNDRFDAFVSHWNEQNYDQMYEMFSTESQSSYTKEESVQRKEKIYEDLEVSELQVSYEPLEEDVLERAMEEGVATIPFQVQMESLAGTISFDYDATLHLEGEEEEENWFVQWDSGFIFPEIKDGGEIRFSTSEPKRGEILDRNQMPLALNDEVYEVSIVPEKLGENADQSIEEIAELLGTTVESIDNKLNASWVQPEWAVPITRISKDEEAVKNQLLEIDGIQISTTTGRVYPAGEAAAHLTGYLRTVRADDFEEFDENNYAADDMIGARGLERLFEEQLKGERGVKIYVEKEGKDEVILAEKEAKNGENLVLSLDINIQEKIYESYGEDAGTAAAIHPQTGETLALVSSPSFDPNEVMYGTTDRYMESLDQDEQLPLINRIVSSFSPGSAIKPITAAIGLDNGTITPEEGIEIEGLQWGKESWGDYQVTRVSTSNGPVDLEDALVRSDNIYFAMKAVEMGADALRTGLENFGFGEEMPYEYDVTTSSISNSGTIDNEVLLADTSYGQGQMQMTAIHLATAYTTFLNEGNMLKPIFLADEETGQIWKEGLITAEEAQIIQDALRSVVTDGTATNANIDEFPISGKTGTVELKQTADEDGAENNWFVAYPTEAQDILIALMVENSHEEDTQKAYEKVTDILLDLNN
ncbi:penicillin-binding transpeptidase domain-containing protein [Oceanobacillus salinisoli]|uniref:penicillin-binding transpeptidase domain-containing protein n=1 Tax=Oceanobacillus salinisoli TaxID=2678611 RepID=UPI0012E28914|nr:penicillin-binding transpeptidase domain-containing protein [Oceanobacillus salinisoli]